MTPSVPSVLNGLARTLISELAPHVGLPYAAQTLQLGAALLMMIGQEFDRAAAHLAEENAALHALFVDGQAVVGDAALRDALRSAVEAPAPGLLVSALRERNRLLRGLLVRLHEHVESLPGDAARALEARIWAELVASTARRQLDLAIG